jgi:hypothetical protein
MRKIRFYYDVVCPYSYMETHAREAAEDAGRSTSSGCHSSFGPAPSSTPVAIIPLVPRAD